MKMSGGRRDFRPVGCLEGSRQITDYAFAIVAKCAPPPIFVPSFSDQAIGRDQISFVIVICDILIVFTLYLSLVCLKNFQNKMTIDIGAEILTAVDFAVCIKNLPGKRIKNKEHLLEIKTLIWAWAENILNLEDSSKYLNPQNGFIDQN